MKELTARVVFPNGERRTVAEGETVVIDDVWYRAHLQGQDGETSIFTLEPIVVAAQEER